MRAVIGRGALIAEYYDRIDDADHAWVAELFAEDAIYLRAGAEYRGRARIERFFVKERKIVGSHKVTRIFEDLDSATVVALGSFEGFGEAGDPRSMQFADVWQFDRKERVNERLTFLAFGHELIER